MITAIAETPAPSQSLIHTKISQYVVIVATLAVLLGCTVVGGFCVCCVERHSKCLQRQSKSPDDAPSSHE